MRVLGVIPARLGSTRLPNKPLQMLAGEPLITRVIQHVQELGLVDEFNVVIHPIVVGPGRRLDGISLAENLQLQLVDSKIFKSGFVALRYLRQ